MGLNIEGGYVGGGETYGGAYESESSKRGDALQKWLAEEIERQQGLLKKKKKPEFDLAKTKRVEKKSLRKKLGLPTILTSPLGLTGQAPTRKATLLGG